MEKLVVRPCEIEDYKGIHRINQNAFGYEYPIDKTKQRLAHIIQKPSDRIFVACTNNNVVGYAHGADYECTYSDSLKNVIAIAVDENYRGLGIGRALLASIEAWAKEDNCCGVRLVSGFNRMEAHKFYLKVGYVVRKDQKNFIKIF